MSAAGSPTMPVDAATTLAGAATLTLAATEPALPAVTPTGRRAATQSPSLTPATPVPTEGAYLTPTVFHCGSGQITLAQIPNPFSNGPLSFRLFTPPCYTEEPERRYPVLYLLHGLGYNDDQWDRLGVDETAAALMESGELPPFLIVMPNDPGWAQPESDDFDEALVEALIPWVDEHYRTCAARACRAVGGLSRGAGWAARLGLAHWELFGAVGAHSLATMWQDASLYDGWLATIPAEEAPRFYLDIADHDREEIRRSALDLENLLTVWNVPHEFHLFAGYHNEAYWGAHVEDYLRWYAAGWER